MVNCCEELLDEATPPIQAEHKIPDQITALCNRKDKSPTNKKMEQTLKRTESSERLRFLSENSKLQDVSQAALVRGDSRTGMALDLCSSRARVTAGLSKEKIAALEKDIFNPLDYCEIILRRMKTGQYRGKTVTSMGELFETESFVLHRKCHKI